MVSGAAENRLSSREMLQVGWAPEQKPGLRALPHWESSILPQGLCTRHCCYQIHTPSIIFKMKYFTLKENQKFKNVHPCWFCGTLSFIHFLLTSMRVIISRFLPSQTRCFEHSDVHPPTPPGPVFTSQPVTHHSLDPSSPIRELCLRVSLPSLSSLHNLCHYWVPIQEYRDHAPFAHLRPVTSA